MADLVGMTFVDDDSDKAGHVHCLAYDEVDADVGVAGMDSD